MVEHNETAQRAIEVFQESGDIFVSEVATVLFDTAARQKLYKHLFGRQLGPFAPLIRAAFRQEVAYRNALWHGISEESDAYYEGIYRCAFLLYRLATVEDLASLWAAKYLNMDVGSSLGAEFFVGAGVEQSLEFLATAPFPEAADIREYVSGWFDQAEAREWQKGWEEDMRQVINYA